MAKNIIQTLTDETFDRQVLDSACPVVVEFTTQWCGSSHIHAPILAELAAQYQQQIEFYQIDMDHYPGIADRFGIQRIPTLLFFRNGQVVDFLTGAVSREMLVEKLKLMIHPTV